MGCGREPLGPTEGSRSATRRQGVNIVTDMKKRQKTHHWCRCVPAMSARRRLRVSCSHLPRVSTHQVHEERYSTACACPSLTHHSLTLLSLAWMAAPPPKPQPPRKKQPSKHLTRVQTPPQPVLLPPPPPPQLLIQLGEASCTTRALASKTGQGHPGQPMSTRELSHVPNLRQLQTPGHPTSQAAQEGNTQQRAEGALQSHAQPAIKPSSSFF